MGRAAADRAAGGRVSTDRSATHRADPATKGRPPAGRDAARKSSTSPAQRPLPAAARIEQVREVLGEVLQWAHPADAVLSHWLRARPHMGARDRAEVAEAVFDVLRHLRRYRHFAESGSGPAARRLAILGLASVFSEAALDAALLEDEREWLARLRRIDPASLPAAVRHSLPDWLEQRLAAVPRAEQLIEALNCPAPLDVRVNPLKTERGAVLEALRAGPAARYSPEPTRHSPWGIRLQGRPPVNRWPLFENGSLEVQDEGSQILAALVAPKRGEMVIDYCAGAGGKTLLLGALMRSTGRLYAFDVSAARLARAKPRVARSGLSNVVPVVIRAEGDQRVKRLAGKAHRVLVDAPCSGLGTLRRNPDLKWRQHPESLAELRQVQARILRQAARCVAPGGRLVYATCSILSEENEDQVQAFLAENPEFELLEAGPIVADRCENLTFEGPYLALRPDLHGTDGFFAAALQRRKPVQPRTEPESELTHKPD
ncbi:rRNA methyltransferase [Candidimonas nitroreducens]|uniref:rRNA methyltransferase n=1 Tax=Candidimonas nitroreducens TaxID=683354 RepID=A0A225M8K8_9BURK|nr:rRNA methyltransferase [Candidimonas nitroreducens]